MELSDGARRRRMPKEHAHGAFRQTAWPTVQNPAAAPALSDWQYDPHQQAVMRPGCTGRRRRGPGYRGALVALAAVGEAPSQQEHLFIDISGALFGSVMAALAGPPAAGHNGEGRKRLTGRPTDSLLSCCCPVASRNAPAMAAEVIHTAAMDAPQMRRAYKESEQARCPD